MIARTLATLGGLGSGLCLSQFPAWAQAYLQRLGGHVDALRRVVAEFDADAAALGMERQVALLQLAQSGDLGAARAETMRETALRYEDLSADLAELSAMEPVERFLHLGRFADAEIAHATLTAFEPAMPLSADAIVLTGAGFVLGWGAIRLLGFVGCRTMRRVFAWKRRAQGAPRGACLTLLLRTPRVCTFCHTRGPRARRRLRKIA